ncbi:MAG: dihydroorotase [Tenacibaculum sp.]
MKTLLKSAKIIDILSPFHNRVKDILIVDGIIAEINDNIPDKEEYKTVELNNLHLTPGWFDTSVSLGEPGYEERETLQHGLQVAAKCGFTAIALNPNTQPVTESKASVAFLISKSKGCTTDLYPIGALTKQSKGLEMAELFDMQQSGAIAFGDYNKPIVNDNLLKLALLYAQNFNGLIISFPKNSVIAGSGYANEGFNSTLLGLKGIPSLAEEMQIARDIFLLEYTKGKLHIPTISTEKSVKLIKQAKEQGMDISCSVAVHNLFLTDDELHDFDARKKVTPPLRTKTDTKTLIKGLKDGVIDMITTDHNPINIEHKKVEFSKAKNGTVGFESAFATLNTILDLETIHKTLSLKPKKRFGIKYNSIQKNQKANLCLFNPDGEFIFTEKHLLSTSKNSAFLGKKLKGKTYGSFNNKQLILNEL